MMGGKMTMRDLSQLYYLNKEIPDEEERLYRLESEAQRCTAALSGMPGSGAENDRIGKLGAEIADLREVIQAKILLRTAERRKLERYIADIEDSYLRQIMVARFIDGLSWSRVANRIGGNNTGDGCRMAVKRFLAK